MSENDVPTNPNNTAPEEPSTTSAQFFADLVGKMLEEHEAKEMAAIQRMTKMVDSLIHDARGLHLQSAAHGNNIARLESDVSELKSRLETMETSLEALKEFQAASLARSE